MAITHEQFIQLLSERLGRPAEEISKEFNQLIEQIQTNTANGDEFSIDKFGTFKIKNDRLSFEVDPTFALEINYKYAGMNPVELKEGKSVAVDEEAKSSEGEEKDEPLPAGEKSEKEEDVPDQKEEEQEQEDEEETGKEIGEIRTEPEPDWVAEEVTAGDESDEVKSDQQRAHVYRSPNRLLNDDEVPKRRTGLFIVIILVLGILFAGYFFIVQKQGAPVADNDTRSQLQGDSVYVHEDNARPAIRKKERNATEDTANAGGGTAVSESTEPGPSNGRSTTAGSQDMEEHSKKSARTNTATVSETVAKQDSAEAQNIINDLSEASLYGLHGKTSDEIGDYYTIVVASLRDQSKAREVGKRWKTRKYRVIIAPGQVHGQTWYRVGLGQFASISDAQEAVQKLPDRLHDNQHHFIRRIHQ